MWKGEDHLRPQIASQSHTVHKVLYAIFFYSKGPVVQVPVPEGSIVTGTFHKEKVLKKVVDHYKEVHPSTGTRSIHLLQDNALVMNNQENFTIDYRDTIGDQLLIDLSKLSNTMNQFEFIMYFKIF